MLSNPVLSREFLTSLRTPRAAVLGMVYLTLMAGLVMLMWPAEGVYSLAAASSHKLFTLLSLGFLTLVSLCAPSFTAISITMEKERETYDLLYDTLLRPDEIVLGKLVAGLGYIFILIVGSLPMMGACLILGGVDRMAIAKVYLIVTVAGVFFSLLGLYFSAFSRSSYRAMITCYAAIIAICGLTWVPSIVRGPEAWDVHYDHLVRGISPYAAILSIVNPDMFQGEHPSGLTALGGFADSMWVFPALATFGGFILLLVTLKRIAKPPQPRRHDDENIIGDKIELIKRHVRFPFYLIDPRKRKRMFGSILNIIAAKEMRCKAFGRALWVIRSMYFCLGASLVLSLLPLFQFSSKAGVNKPLIVFGCIAMPLGIIILLSPVLTASSITDERESGVFDMLRCTRLSAWTIVMGKLQVAWFFVMLIVASTFPTFLVMAYMTATSKDMGHINTAAESLSAFDFSTVLAEVQEINPEFFYSLLRTVGVVVINMLFATMTGIAASAFSRKSSTATAIAYGVVLTVAIGTMIPYFIAESLPREVVHAALALNPFAAAASTTRAEEILRIMPEDLWLTHYKVIGGATVLLFITTITRVWLLMRPQK